MDAIDSLSDPLSIRLPQFGYTNNGMVPVLMLGFLYSTIKYLIA